jgi:hypothetical protein
MPRLFFLQICLARSDGIRRIGGAERYANKPDAAQKSEDLDDIRHYVRQAEKMPRSKIHKVQQVLWATQPTTSLIRSTNGGFPNYSRTRNLPSLYNRNPCPVRTYSESASQTQSRQFLLLILLVFSLSQKRSGHLEQVMDLMIWVQRVIFPRWISILKRKQR